MSVRYLGSKARVVESIGKIIGLPRAEDGFFVDAFCGTGVVAEAAARLGWRVRLNDNLHAAVTMAAARLASENAARFGRLGGYDATIRRLNALKPSEGFVWREYSPASARLIGHSRRYFTESNAGRIDAIRSQIREWAADELLTPLEERLLIADLLLASNRVANIAGTYGCFLREWQAQATQNLILTARTLFPLDVELEVTVDDIGSVVAQENDTVYLDPPYTKRQYAAYYHILETIAVGDQPKVEGVTGLRPWRAKASEFCYKRRALPALERLLSRLNASRVLLSYSGEGHVDLSVLRLAAEQFGSVELIELQEIGRYRPNATASEAGSKVLEILLVIQKAASTAAA